jgi:hypothetical protein
MFQVGPTGIEEEEEEEEDNDDELRVIKSTNCEAPKHGISSDININVLITVKL